MDAWVWVLVVLVILALAAAAWFAWSRQRSRRLQQTFGPEYERTVAQSRDRREAEAELEARRKTREELEIRPLPEGSRRRYGEQWEAVQARFVDDPVGAVGAADRLVEQVMSERGYPMQDFDTQAELVSVDHPDVVENYRTAHSIYLAHDRGDASTEDLRRAMVHYRSLFDELLSDRATDGARSRVGGER